MDNKPDEVRVVARLEMEMYLALERKLPAPTCEKDCTDLQAGYRLGIQHVLKILREGYVINRG